MKRSCLTVVLREQTERCRSLTFPFVLTWFISRRMEDGCTLYSLATSFGEKPAVGIPKSFDVHFQRVLVVSPFDIFTSFLLNACLTMILDSKLFPDRDYSSITYCIVILS